jgi:hypothetical protein
MLGEIPDIRAVLDHQIFASHKYGGISGYLSSMVPLALSFAVLGMSDTMSYWLFTVTRDRRSSERNAETGRTCVQRIEKYRRMPIRVDITDPASENFISLFRSCLKLQSLVSTAWL